MPMTTASTRFLRGVFLRDVLDQRQRTLVATRRDFVGHSVEWLLPASNDRELAAFVREQVRDAAPDPHAGAGDERDLAGELQIHRTP